MRRRLMHVRAAWRARRQLWLASCLIVSTQYAVDMLDEIGA